MESQLFFVTPGQLISQDSDLLRGHGTRLTYDDEKHQENIVSTVSGFVEHVNKLISVRPLKSRYHAEVGDVIVGRIIDVGDKRWEVDICEKQASILMLSAIILPGQTQRRKTAEDSLQMRSYYKENDLISAEIQSFFHDGAAALHTRSTKYGKLGIGQLVIVPSRLVKRCKQHFIILKCNVNLILGKNGYCWLSPPSPLQQEQQTFDDDDDDEINKTENIDNTDLWERIARVANSIRVLSATFYSIYPETIMSVYNSSIELGIPTGRMLDRSILDCLTSQL